MHYSQQKQYVGTTSPTGLCSEGQMAPSHIVGYITGETTTTAKLLYRVTGNLHILPSGEKDCYFNLELKLIFG